MDIGFTYKYTYIDTYICIRIFLHKDPSAQIILRIFIFNKEQGSITSKWVKLDSNEVFPTGTLR